MLEKPYVISRGLRVIMKEWCMKNNFIAPKDDFFQNMGKKMEIELKKIFSRVEIVTHTEMFAGIKTIVINSKLTPLSLDRIYTKSFLNLDVTRKMLPNSKKYIIGNRFGTAKIEEQLSIIKNTGIKEVILIDDVLFSGSTIINIIKKLKNIGVKVKLVCVGIAIKEGIENVEKYCKVKPYKAYDEVIDEICNWDFYPGVPLSGRLMTDSNTGKSYCSPFGDIVNWASIPKEYEVSFSQFLIRESIKLFEEIEEKTGRDVLCKNLDRKVYGMPIDETRFVDALKEYLHR